MENFVGIHWILASTPIWFTVVILWLCTDGVIHLMRDKFEGLGYQVSYSAKFGDAGLIAAVLIAATILQRTGTYVPTWLQSGLSQIGILAICIALGLAVSVKTLDARSGKTADVYHDVIIAPAILFFAITLMPVVWYNARWYEASFVIIAIVAWGWLVRIDIAGNRLNQRQWLVRHGFPMKGEVP